MPYNEAIGSVLWLAVMSRPDIAFAVGILSQYIQNLGPAHWEALKQNFGGKQEKWVEGYSDMWAGQTDCHLISGYAFFLGNGAMPWSSKKQHIIASSSTESKYISQTHAAKEAIWLKNFLDEVNVVQGSTIKIHCDNQGAIALAKDNKYHSCTKHIDLRFHFVREAVEEEKIVIGYIPTEDNITDIFMKALPRLKFIQFMEKLGLAEMMKEKWVEEKR